MGLDKLESDFINYPIEIYKSIDKIMDEFFYLIGVSKNLYSLYEVFKDEIIPIQDNIFDVDMSKCAIFEEECLLQ